LKILTFVDRTPHRLLTQNSRRSQSHLAKILYTICTTGRKQSLSHILYEELGITTALLIDDKLAEFEARWRVLVRPDNRVESRRPVRCVLTIIFAAAARSPFELFGDLTDVGSTEQNSRQEHVQLCSVFSPFVFITHI